MKRWENERYLGQDMRVTAPARRENRRDVGPSALEALINEGIRKFLIIEPADPEIRSDSDGPTREPAPDSAASRALGSFCFARRSCVCRQNLAASPASSKINTILSVGWGGQGEDENILEI